MNDEKWRVYYKDNALTIQLVKVHMAVESPNGFVCICELPDSSVFVNKNTLFDTYEEAFEYCKNEYGEE